VEKKLLRIIVAGVILLITIWALSNLISSFKNIDRDGDGLTDNMEGIYGTNPLDYDSDSDDFEDGEEYDYWVDRSQDEQDEDLAPDGDIDGDGDSNILDDDSDNDGLTDGEEIEYGTDPAKKDTDGDGLSDAQEIRQGTNPLNPDSDMDGTPDGSDSRPTPPTNPDDLTYTPGDLDDASYCPCRYGYGVDVTCFAVFNPYLGSLKRSIVYDSVTVDYKTYIADPTPEQISLSDTKHDNVFVGTITLNDVRNDYVAIPSVAPDANIISYSTSPTRDLNFYKDGADNYYVRPTVSYYSSEVVLTFTTSADSSYYTYDVPDDLTLDDIPNSEKHTPPDAVISKASIVINDLGLSGEKNLKTIVGTLYDYFSSFTSGEMPSEDEQPDLYLAIAQSKHGKCDIRSFAFFVTANSIGIPTRFVLNECHGFVEVYIPTNGWMRLNLGGLGADSKFQNPDGYPPFDNSTQPDLPQVKPVEPGPGLISTTTEVTIVSSTAYKEGYFTVEGYVNDDQQKGVSGISVEIYVTKIKSIHGNIVATGQTKLDGTFSIQTEVPEDATVGENHVIAHAVRNDIYGGSWSDPIMEIYSDTTLTLDMASSVGQGDALSITGFLQDASGQALSEKTINVYWIGNYIGTDDTDSNGVFLLSYTPSNSIGSYEVSSVFTGDQYLTSSSDSKTIAIRDTRTRLDVTVTPTTIKRGDQLYIIGSLYDGSDNVITDASIDFFYNNEQVLETSTSTNGDFEETITVPKNFILGNVKLKIHYPGTEMHAEANVEEIILVRSDTTLEITMPVKINIEQNETITISGILKDDNNEPINDMSLTILLESYNADVTTNETGIFNHTYTIPSDLSLGTKYIKSVFDGNTIYYPSNADKQINIVQPGYIEKSQNTNILLAITLAIIIITLIGGIMLFKKQKTIEGPTIEEIASKTITELKTENDYKKSVINCYKQMCEWLGRKGVQKEFYQTPREFAMASKDYLNMSSESLYTLTQVFEKARYSKHDVSSEDKDKAISCLNEIISAQVEETPVENVENVVSREGTNA
jgi:hypothetical protein